MPWGHTRYILHDILERLFIFYLVTGLFHPQQRDKMGFFIFGSTDFRSRKSLYSISILQFHILHCWKVQIHVLFQPIKPTWCCWYESVVLTSSVADPDPHGSASYWEAGSESASERLVGFGSISQKPDPNQHHRQNSVFVEKCLNKIKICEQVSIS